MLVVDLLAVEASDSVFSDKWVRQSMIAGNFR